MNPSIVTAIAAARQADLVRVADHHRQVRLARAVPPSHRGARRGVTGTASQASERVRLQVRRLLTLTAPQQSAAEPCCA